MPEITAERARELLSYDPSTGELTWRVNRGGRAVKGARAGSPHPQGYTVAKIDSRPFLCHRIVWLLVTGAWPQNEIDHINGNPADNRFENLRDVSHKTNQENQRRAATNNAAGLLGAHWHAQKQRFRARIKHNRKNIHLGMFTTPEAAHEAYLTAKRQLHAGCTI